MHGRTDCQENCWEEAIGRCSVCWQRLRMPMLVLGSRCLCHAVRAQPLSIKRTSLRLVSCMYADREPRQRYAQYRANAADFGMGSYRHRNRSPVSLFTRAAATDAEADAGENAADAFVADAGDTVQVTVARRVYVGNLAFSVGWQDLKDHFRQAGPVLHAHIGGAKGVRRTKGWGIVEFETPEDAAVAIQQLDRSQIHGREVFVREDRDDYELPGNNRQDSSSPRYSDRRSNKPYDSGVNRAGTRLFVSNLNPMTTWQELKDYFRTVGNVTYANVFTGEGGQSKCVGIVQYEQPQDAQQAIASLTETPLDGFTIYVREDKQDYTQKTEYMSQGGNRSGRDVFNPSTGVNVIVQGLPFSYGWQDLKDLFQDVGGVLSADIVMGRDGRSRGWGVVNMASVEDGERAIQMLNGQDCGGRYLGVKLDEQKRSPVQQPRSPPRNPNASIPGRQVRVQGLPANYAWQDLKDIFNQYGAIRADIVPGGDAESGYNGIVRFTSAEAAENAVKETQGTVAGGQTLRIDIDPLTPTQSDSTTINADQSAAY